MNIEIKNLDFTTYGVISDFISCKFEQSFNSKGKFEIVVNSNKTAAKYLAEDKIVYLADDKIGYIDYVKDQKKNNAAGTLRIARGYELKDRIDRLIYPAAGNVPDSYTNEYVETIIKTLINKNAGAGVSDAKRQITNLVCADDQSRGSQINYSAWLKDSITEIYNLLSVDGMGLICTIDFNAGNIVYDIRESADKTASETTAGGVLLDVDTNDALSIDDINDKLSYKNLSVTAGSGDTPSREIIEVGTTETGYKRREIYTEARDAVTSEDITTAGNLKLAETMKSRSIAINYNPNGRFKINTHFQLGDRISAKADSGIYDAQVTKIISTYNSKNVPDIKLTLGFGEAEIIMASEKARRMDISSLKAAGSGLSGGMVADVMLTEDYASIEVTDLDIVTDGVYDFVISGDAASNGGVYIYANTDTTPSNYASQSLRLNGTTPTLARYAAPVIIAGDTAQFTAHGVIVLNPKTKHFVASSKGSEEVNTVEGRIYEVVSINTFDNIDKITFYNPTGNFIAGTRLTLTLRG